MDIYLLIEGQQQGPYTEADTRKYLAEGRIQGDLLAWREGLAEWMPLLKLLKDNPQLPPPFEKLNIKTVPVPIGNVPGLVLTQSSDQPAESLPLAKPEPSQPPLNSTTVDPTRTFFVWTLGAFFLLLNTHIAAIETTPLHQFLDCVYIPLFLLIVIFTTQLHFACWKALPLEFRGTTPAKAVGFMYIPLFNLYWAFITWPKLAEGYTRWIKSKGRSIPVAIYPASVALAILFIYLFVSLLVPEVSFDAELATYCIILLELALLLLFYNNICKAANVLNSTQTELSLLIKRALVPQWISIPTVILDICLCVCVINITSAITNANRLRGDFSSFESNAQSRVLDAAVRKSWFGDSSSYDQIERQAGQFSNQVDASSDAFKRLLFTTIGLSVACYLFGAIWMLINYITWRDAAADRLRLRIMVREMLLTCNKYRGRTLLSFVVFGFFVLISVSFIRSELCDPSQADMYMSRAFTKRDNGDLKGAMSDLSEAIYLYHHKNPQDQDTLYVLSELYEARGNSKWRLGDLKGSIDDLKQSASLDVQTGNTPESKWVEIWEVEVKKGDVDLAYKELSSALDNGWVSTPTDQPTDQSTLNAKFLVGRINETEYIANTLNNVNYESVAWYYVGIKKLMAGDKESAKADFLKCLASSDDEYGRGKWDDAKRELAKLDRAPPPAP